MEDNVVRKTTARKVVRKTAVRKAPTQAAPEGVRERRTMLPFMAIGVFVVIVGASVAVGFSDDGQINVENTINNKRDFGTEEEKEALQNIPVQRARPSAPNGGLVPTADPDPGAPAPVPVETGTSTATSTEEGAEASEESSEGETADETSETPETETEVAAEAEATEPPAEEPVSPETSGR